MNRRGWWLYERCLYLDWRPTHGQVRRCWLPFGHDTDHRTRPTLREWLAGRRGREGNER